MLQRSNISQGENPLGNGLEARIRGAQGRISGLRAHNSIFISSSSLSPITTTQRTMGMPAGSNHNLLSYLAAADTLQIASSAAADTSAGDGARQITISGLDANWNKISELVSLSGNTPVVTIQEFLRINLIQVEEVGSDGRNRGDIYVSDSGDTFSVGVSVTQTLFAMLRSVDADNPQNISSFGTRSIPANHRFWLVKGNYYTDATTSKVLSIKEDYFTESALGNRIQYTGGELPFSQSISFDFTGAAHFKEKTDYNFKVNSSTGTINGSIYYEAVEERILDETI